MTSRWGRVPGNPPPEPEPGSACPSPNPRMGQGARDSTHPQPPGPMCPSSSSRDVAGCQGPHPPPLGLCGPPPAPRMGQGAKEPLTSPLPSACMPLTQLPGWGRVPGSPHPPLPPSPGACVPLPQLRVLLPLAAWAVSLPHRWPWGREPILVLTPCAPAAGVQSSHPRKDHPGQDSRCDDNQGL